MTVPAYLRPVAAVAAFVLTLTALPGCDKDTVLKTIDVRLDTDLTMNISSSDTLSGVFRQELDPDANSDVKNNRSKIKKVVIDRLSYNVADFTGAAGTLASGVWKVYPSDAPTQMTTVATVSNLDLDAKHTAGTEISLAISDAAKAKLVDMINNKKKITFVFEGDVSHGPTLARYQLHLFTKIDVGI